MGCTVKSGKEMNWEILKNNRRWIGIEISEEYCKIAKKRLTSMQQVLFYKE